MRGASVAERTLGKNSEVRCVLVAVRGRYDSAHLFFKLHNELFRQLDHLVRIFFALNLARQVTPIRG